MDPEHELLGALYSCPRKGRICSIPSLSRTGARNASRTASRGEGHLDSPISISSSISRRRRLTRADSPATMASMSAYFRLEVVVHGSQTTPASAVIARRGTSRPCSPINRSVASRIRVLVSRRPVQPCSVIRLFESYNRLTDDARSKIAIWWKRQGRLETFEKVDPSFPSWSEGTRCGSGAVRRCRGCAG